MSSETMAPLIALAGSPNSGKTALFNALTGSHQKVANYPGVTVERKEGHLTLKNGKRLRILDLPGTYSLNAQSPDEEVTRDVLLEKYGSNDTPEVLVAVADATNLERSLGLILELRHLGRPIVLALNMMDLAQKRGLKLSLEKLSRELKIPVVPTVAVKKEGLNELMKLVEVALEQIPLSAATRTAEPTKPSHLSTPQEVVQRYAEIDHILSSSQFVAAKPSTATEKIDAIVLHPVWGALTLLALLTLMFQAIFNWSEPGMDAIEKALGFTGDWFKTVIPEGALQSLLVDGIISGVGSVLVFLPQILILFFFILVLEDFGYMARAAFIMDRMMGKMGLHGRAFIPLLSSHACAIPGIMAARTISNPKDRLATIMVAPLTTCSARLPVYSLLIAAFIPNVMVAGGLKLQGLVMLGLYLAGILSALVMAYVFRKSILKGPTPPFLLELPSYKVPSLRNLVIGLWERARLFLRRAGTIILSLSILLWFLSTYPKSAEEEAKALGQPPIYSSYAGKIGRAIQPILAPLGFDWRTSVALIPGFAAREVMVSALATVYAVEAGDAPQTAGEPIATEAPMSDEDKVQATLITKITKDWSLAVALSLLAWYVFAPQCLSTIAVVRRETNSWKWPILMLVYLTVLAYVASLLVYQGARWVGWG